MAGVGGDAGYVEVRTAAASREEADAITAALLGSRLAACVQVLGPVHSRYRWKGNVESAQEWLCVAKTAASRAADVMAEIARVHSYETPEIVVTPILSGSPSYLAWIDAEVTDPGDE